MCLIPTAERFLHERWPDILASVPTLPTHVLHNLLRVLTKAGSKFMSELPQLRNAITANPPPNGQVDTLLPTLTSHPVGHDAESQVSFTEEDMGGGPDLLPRLLLDAGYALSHDEGSLT